MDVMPVVQNGGSYTYGGWTQTNSIEAMKRYIRENQPNQKSNVLLLLLAIFGAYFLVKAFSG